MLNNFIYAKQKSLFEEALNNGEVLDEAIVFIEDTKEIWNHGTYFDGSKVDLSNIETSILNIIDNYATKTEIPTKVSQLENDKNYIENGDGYESGVYIAVQSGKLINPNEYDSTTETAVGVAVIDPKANFIIGLNHTTSISWGKSAQGLHIDIPGLKNYSDKTSAATDMDGIANTNAITAIYSGTDCAAGLAKSQSITYGSDSLTGYLGSAGEWLIVLNNHEAVKSAMAIAGGNCFQTTSSLYYCTSTEYSHYSYAWYAYFLVENNNFYLYNNDKGYWNACVVPFYKIDNETTILSKINLISTPAGSSTAPIYIDSNGNITSTTYGGGTKVTLNGSAKGGSTASFYAPTSAGTSGYILKSNGSGAPSWGSIKTINGVSILGSGDIAISSGSTSPLYPQRAHQMDDDNVTINAGEYHIWSMDMESLTISLSNPSGGYAPHWIFRFYSGATPTTLTLPDGLKWANGNEISISANKTYEVSITEGLAVWAEF